MDVSLTITSSVNDSTVCQCCEETPLLSGIVETPRLKCYDSDSLLVAADMCENIPPSTSESSNNRDTQSHAQSVKPECLSPPEWLKPHYTPPKLRGLDVLPEGRIVRPDRHPLGLKKSANGAIRLQVFTGQTLDEACLPKCPGGTLLNPDFVKRMTKQRVLLRRKKARLLGFKGVHITAKTERRMLALMRQKEDSPCSPDEHM